MVQGPGDGGGGTKKRLTGIHRYLDGDEEAPYPERLWLWHLMERFPGRFLSEIVEELERLDGVGYPAGLLNEVLEAGSYKQAFEMTQRADEAGDTKSLPDTLMFRRVREIEFGLRQGGARG